MVVRELSDENRHTRKYPRMPIAHACTIKINDLNDNISGRMYSISVGGFFYVCLKGRLLGIDKFSPFYKQVQSFLVLLLRGDVHTFW